MSAPRPAIVTVMESSPAKGVDRLVLAAVASFADPDGANCYPSEEGIAQRAGMSVRSVQRAIRRLRRAAEVDRAQAAGDWDRAAEIASGAELEVLPRRGGRGRNLYVIRVLEELFHAHVHAQGDPTPVVVPDPFDPPPVVAPRPVEATPVVATPATGRQIGPTGRHLRPPEATPAADRGDSSWRTTIQDHPGNHSGPSSARKPTSRKAREEEPERQEREPTAEERLVELGCDPEHPLAVELLELGDREALWGLGVGGDVGKGPGAVRAALAYLRIGARGGGQLEALRAARRAAADDGTNDEAREAS